MRATFVCTFTLVALLFASLTAFGQGAQISGVITDPAGAVIPKAEVRVVNQGTHAERKVQTNDTGYFTAPFLEVGTYVVYVAAAGFATSVSEPVVAHVGDALALNIRLKVGATTETVNVEGGAPLVNTQNAAVSTVVDRQFAENLPMNGRSFQTLIQL